MMLLIVTVILLFSFFLFFKWVISYPKQAFFFTAVCFSSLTAVFFWYISTMNLFLVVKMWTLLGSLLFVFFISYQNYTNVSWVSKVAWILLLINILEAILWDLKRDHGINVINGLLLMAAMPSYRRINIENHRMMADFPFLWILAYSFWNWTFIYGCFLNLAIQHIILLMAPLVVALFYDRQLWLYARCFSLFLWIYFNIYFKHILVMDILPPSFTIPYDLWSYVVLVVCLASMCQRWCMSERRYT